MAMTRKEPLFDAPIPGQSLTMEVGSRPWQTPAQFVTLEEAVDYYVSKLSTDEVANQVIDVLEMDVSVAELAHIIQLGSVMEGIHNIDIGVLVTPVIMEFIMLIADSVGMDYRTGIEDEEFANKDALVKRAMRKFEEEQDESPKMDEEVEEQADVVAEEKPTGLAGLMARRN